MNFRLNERLDELRFWLVMECWWPPSSLKWKIGKWVKPCAGCGRRFRTKHISAGVIYVEPWIPNPPAQDYCDTACRRPA